MLAKKSYVKFTLLILVGITTIIGCSASGPVFSPVPLTNDKAVIYVYRRAYIAGSANVWHLHANGAHVAEVSNGGYFAYLAAEGNVSFSVKLRPGVGTVLTALVLREEELITIPAEAGETYYVRFNLGPSMELVSKDEGQREIAGLHRFDLVGDDALP